VLVFRGGYHGGLLTFTAGPSPVNAPYDVLLAEYNDAAGARALLREHAGSLACVLVEPMLGSGGCIPGDPAFLSVLREATRQAGALLIFDEVMTSRTGPGGLQARLGIWPDLTTLGKYIGGGASFGAFGGRADVMELFDPARPGALPHAGTFNNNVVSMAAGHAGLTQVYPPETAQRHTARGDALREELAQMFRAAGAPFQATGVGSLLAIHATAAPVRSPRDLGRSDPRLLELLFLDLLELGYYIAPAATWRSASRSPRPARWLRACCGRGPAQTGRPVGAGRRRAVPLLARADPAPPGPHTGRRRRRRSGQVPRGSAGTRRTAVCAGEQRLVDAARLGGW
jgi:glutamate-1-semialdehyde 2,1-aminomutase